MLGLLLYNNADVILYAMCMLFINLLVKMLGLVPSWICICFRMSTFLLVTAEESLFQDFLGVLVSCMKLIHLCFVIYFTGESYQTTKYVLCRSSVGQH